MPKRLLKNAGYSTAGQIVNMAVSILFVPAYIHFLGINGYGIYSFLLLVFGWITILQAGIDPAVVRMTAKYVAENNYKNINSLITASMLFQIAIATLIAVAFILSSDFLAAFIVKNEISFLSDTKIALYYAGINIIILMCRNVYIALFMGLQRYDISSISDAFFNLLASLLALLALWLGYGIVGIIVVRLIINIASLAMLHYVAKKLVSTFHLSFLITKSLFREIYNYASWIVVGRINRLAVNAIPPILIGMYVGPSGIAYYNISSRIVLTFNNLLASSINVIFPFVSELTTLKEAGRIKSAYLGANRLLSLVSAPIYCVGVIYSWDLLYLWLGGDIADHCWMLMMIFFIGYYLSSCSMVPSIFALGIGDVKILAYTGFAQTAILIITLPFLLTTFGILGAGINLILFESASMVMVTIITTKMVKASNLTFWIKDRLLLLLVSGAIFSVFIPLRGYLSHGSLTRVEMATYLGVVILVGLSIYGAIIKSSDLIDADTKKSISRMFHKTG